MGSDIFCKLYDVWKKEEGKIIFENDFAYSIFSVTPATPGHAIVISKPHVELIEELRGNELEGFVDAFSGTSFAIQSIYNIEPEQMVNFYNALKINSPTPASAEAAQRMLDHRHLRVKPDTSYNIGINVGGYAGQMVNHLHAQLFPRREKGLGVVTAMEYILK